MTKFKMAENNEVDNDDHSHDQDDAQPGQEGLQKQRQLWVLQKKERDPSSLRVQESNLDHVKWLPVISPLLLLQTDQLDAGQRKRHDHLSLASLGYSSLVLFGLSNNCIMA